MNKAELKAKLDEKGITYSELATNEELETLLANSEKDITSDFSDGVKTEEVKVEEKTNKKSAPKIETDPKKVTENTIKSEVQATRDHLETLPKVSMFIPLDRGEKKGQAVETVTLNGCVYTYKKGMTYDMPEPIANILKESLNLTPYGDEKRMDRDNSVIEALN
jgi:hypothetical protein